jgi:hypothetical protein
MHVLDERGKLISKFNMNVMSYISLFCCQLLDMYYRSVTATQFTVPQNDRLPANYILMRGPKVRCEFAIKKFRGVYFFISNCISVCLCIGRDLL